MLTKILLGREPHLSTRLRPRGLQQGQGRLRKGRVRSLARSFRRQAQGGRRGLHGNGIVVQIRKTGKQSKQSRQIEIEIYRHVHSNFLKLWRISRLSKLTSKSCLDREHFETPWLKTIHFAIFNLKSFICCQK
jgi:hypothetical protein